MTPCNSEINVKSHKIHYFFWRLQFFQLSGHKFIPKNLLGTYSKLYFILVDRVMEAVAKARNRIRLYPSLIGECRHEGKLYASCIASQKDIRLDSCANEFRNFKNCLVKTAVKLGTRI